ncbi:MAG: ABC transporter ATP-binding protein [Sulfobacillus thermotolerans]|nr:ABC transporter ATP-binding protein [Sulfobacillus thermotolerans]
MLVEMRNVHKKIRSHPVLRGIDLQAHESEVVGIIGANGSGKTTLLRAMCGLAAVDSGEVFVMGQLLKPTGPIPQGISVVFDPPALLPDMTGLQNMIVISKIRDLMTVDELRALMKKVGLDAYDKRKVSKYSQGMKKRLALAISMMEEPRLVLMDEPTNALDPSGVSELRSWIVEFASNGAGVVIVSHHTEELNRICDNIYKIVDGVLTRVEDTLMAR